MVTVTLSRDCVACPSDACSVFSVVPLRAKLSCNPLIECPLLFASSTFHARRDYLSPPVATPLCYPLSVSSTRSLYFVSRVFVHACHRFLLVLTDRTGSADDSIPVLFPFLQRIRVYFFPLFIPFSSHSFFFPLSFAPAARRLLIEMFLLRDTHVCSGSCRGVVGIAKRVISDAKDTR